MADPFASVVGTRMLHKSLDTCSNLPFDFYEPIVSSFLSDERYVQWSAGYKPWQLHCFGGPGCGKSTFAARVVDDLKQRHQAKDIPIAYIRIKEHVGYRHASFIEDFLFCLYTQICNQSPYAYEEACRNGDASSERVRRIRTALHQQLTENEHNFLVFDGYDTLDVSTCLLVDHELHDSHLSNLSLLITRRNPLYQRPEHFNISCNNCGRPGLELYWECQICGDSGPQYCCDCIEAGAVCTNENHTLALSEPYSRVDLDINRNESGETYSAMKSFIKQRLEGCLGRTQTVDELAQSISERVGGNVNLAKLRIDDLLSMPIPMENRKLSDRLPRSVVAFFDSEIEQLSEHNIVDRELGLMAIAAVAEDTDPRGFGMKAVNLELSMRQELSSSLNLAHYPARSLENVITAANGLLILMPFEDELHVACFNQMFKTYVKEDYNESLHLAKLKLRLRTESTLEEQNMWHIAPTTSSPPAITDNLDSGDYVEAKSSSQDSAYYSRTSSVNKTGSSPAPIPPTEPKGLFERIGIFTAQSDVEKAPDYVEEQSSCPMTLCKFCREQIVESGLSFGEHHTLVTSVLDALRVKCVICLDLYGSVVNSKNISSNSHTLASQQANYTWRIRSTGRSRNLESSFVVTFTARLNGTRLLNSTPATRKYHIIAVTGIHTAAKGILTSSTDPSQLGGGLQIRDWLKDCNEAHLNCRRLSSDPTFVPKRLVDLELEHLESIRVVDTTEHGIKGPYLTLSHSWGPPTFLQLKRENESILMGPGVRITELTPNFLQAITVARFLGMRYIWIDSLCIMQGSGGDFSTEGQLMHQIYRYSYCNIVAADSEDSQGGLFRKRDPESIMPVSIEADGSGKLGRGTWMVLKDDLWNKDLLATKIYTRGWVFQERMLAPRILHFAGSQIFWDCSTISACEVLPKGLPHAIDAGASIDRHWRGRMQIASTAAQSKYQQPLVGAYDDSIESFWSSALLNYTSCNLTDQGDKSVAIWSIAKLVRDVLDEKYGGGLWEHRLEEQLAWHVRDVARNHMSRLPELQHLHPSWSWVSLKGPIIAHGRLPKAREYVVTDHDGKAIAFKSHFEDNDKEPVLERVPLPMLGYVAQGTLATKAESQAFAVELSGLDQQKPGGSFDVFLDEALPPTSKKDPTSQPFIILASSVTSANESGHYRPSQRMTPRLSGYAATRPTALGGPTAPTTYSGIALLLVPMSAYIARQKSTFKELLQEVVRRSPEQSWPDPPYGKGKSLVDQTRDMQKLVTTLGGALNYVKGKDGTSGQLYRRCGAIEFRDVPESVWKDMTKDGKQKIWLD